MDKQKIEDFAVLNYESAGRKSALMSSTSGAAGYQPYESLHGAVGASSSGSGSATRTVRPSGVLTVQQAGVFGECTDSGILSFLRPVEKSRCSFLPQTLGRDFCEQGLSIRKLLGTSIYPANSDKDTAIPITVGTVAKYDYSDPESMKELTATDP